MKVLGADPLKVGWTHCHAIILQNNTEALEHEVRISMAAGSEQKKFTILGFGVVR